MSAARQSSFLGLQQNRANICLQINRVNIFVFSRIGSVPWSSAEFRLNGVGLRMVPVYEVEMLQYRDTTVQGYYSMEILKYRDATVQIPSIRLLQTSQSRHHCRLVHPLQIVSQDQQACQRSICHRHMAAVIWDAVSLRLRDRGTV